MDTTEERNGTYFYRGHPNLSKIELLNVIFLEEFCKELGIDSVSGAAILSGQPWLGTRAKPQGATTGTSVVSKYARILMRDARMPFGISVHTPVGVRMQKSNKLCCNYRSLGPVDWLGFTVDESLQGFDSYPEKYNLIAKPQDRIKWTSF